MRWLLPLLALLLPACVTEDDPELLDYRPAFVAAEDAWEARFGRLPEECRTLRERAVVAETTIAELTKTCPPEDPITQSTVGCFTHDQAGVPFVLIASEGDQYERMDTAVHEWVHLLAECVDGSSDGRHVRPELWSEDPANPGVVLEGFSRL